MRLPVLPRWLKLLLLAASGIGVLLAAAADFGGDDGTAGRRQRGQRQAREAAARPTDRIQGTVPAHLEIERLAQAAPPVEAAVSNVFGATSWYVPPPPPPPPPPAPPPKPTAPPMPFSYLGSYQDGSLLVVILAKSDRVYTVSLGDVIEGTYRIESIRNRTLEMTYLPLNIRQTIDTGGA